MSAFKKFFIFLTVILVLSMSVLIVVLCMHKDRKIDTVLINDTVQTIKENWDDIDALNDKELKTEVLVLDKDNKEIFSTSGISGSDIKVPLDALGSDMICVTLNDGDLFLGTAVIPNPSKVEYDALIIRIIVVTVVIALVMIISYASFIFYVDHNIVKPFNRMKKFAALIAQGNLDEPLKMEKNNMFGIFTESFDVMREELKASRNREIALKMKEKELVASLSHDLKTPVTGIRVICVSTPEDIDKLLEKIG